MRLVTVFLALTFFDQPRRAAPQARTRAAPHGAESLSGRRSAPAFEANNKRVILQRL